MTLTIRSLAVSLFLTVGLMLVGCGVSENAPAETYPVTGKVTVNGEPLAKGRIYFEDTAKGISNGCEISGGSYSGKAAAGDMKAKIVEIVSVKDPMGNERESEKILQLDVPVVVKNGGGDIPAIEVKQ